ncbi:MAG: ROK family protein [Bacteroidota bacterium]
MQKNISLGIDIGASGIKGALVDIKSGQLITERFRVPTPNPSHPKAVAVAFAEVVKHFEWTKAVGCGFPAIVKNGKTLTAANIDDKWIGAEVEQILSKACGVPVIAANDADLAGVAEMKHGAGKGEKGTVIFVTIGSGLGSAFFREGILIPNTEFGHFYLKGHKVVVEQYAADSVRKKEDLSWTKWAGRFDEYLHMVEKLLCPDLIILGGGASKKFEKFSKVLTAKTRIIPATLLNHAGIIGAALMVHEKQKQLSNKDEKVNA